MKISSNLVRNIKRYTNKNTMQGQLTRNVNKFGLCTTLMGTEFTRVNNWSSFDYLLSGIFILLTMAYFEDCVTRLKEMRGIKKRAKNIFGNKSSFIA